MMIRKVAAVFGCTLVVALFFSWSQSSGSVAAHFAVTDTPVPTDTPETPTATPETPTATPITPTVTNTPATPDPLITPTVTNTPPSAIGTPNPEETPIGSSDGTPIPTPSIIPALGVGPRASTMVLFGVGLLGAFGLLAFGWVKVWQAYRDETHG